MPNTLCPLSATDYGGTTRFVNVTVFGNGARQGGGPDSGSVPRQASDVQYKVLYLPLIMR